jgi:hypothetical protein
MTVLLTPPPFPEVLLPATRSPRLRAGTPLHIGTFLRLAMIISEERKDYFFIFKREQQE